MRRTYHFDLHEEYSRGVSIAAESEEEARAMLEQFYADGRFVLDWDEMLGHRFDFVCCDDDEPDTF